MKRVHGIGGIFFKSGDAPGLRAWYAEHLGIPLEAWGGALFPWAPGDGMTVWSVFERESTYFDPSSQTFMVNYIVDDLDGMLAQLREKGVQVVDHIEDSEYGRFGWAFDPEGNKFELWQPPKKP